MNNYYTPSGKFSPVSIILFLILCVTLFPVLGAIYTYAVWYIPFIYVSFLMTFGLGAGVGFLISKIVIHIGKVRSPKVAFSLVVLGAIVAIYVGWAVWADLIINSAEAAGFSDMTVQKSSMDLEQVLFFLTHPTLLFQLMADINDYGTWGFSSGSSVSGFFLWIVWGLEAIIILATVIIFGARGLGKPFCEKSNKWFKEIALPPTSYIFSKPDLVRELEQGSDRILSTLNLYDVVFDNMSYSQFTVFSSDHDEHYLTAVNMKKMVDNRGEVNYEEDDVIEHIEITTKTLNLLQNVKKKERDTKNESAE